MGTRTRQAPLFQSDEAQCLTSLIFRLTKTFATEAGFDRDRFMKLARDLEHGAKHLDV